MRIPGQPAIGAPTAYAMVRPEVPPFGQIGLADDASSGPEQLIGDRGLVVGARVLQRQRAGRREQPVGGVDAVLNQDRDPPEESMPVAIVVLWEHLTDL